MSFIDKLLSKVNKAKSALNSVKGIESKIKSLNYNSLIDELGEQAAAARDALDDRRKSLESQIGSATRGNYTKQNPAENFKDLQYPLEDLENWIVFRTRARKQRGGGRGANLLSGSEQVEIKLYVPDSLISQANVTYNAKGQSAAIQAIADVIEGFGENGFSGEAFENMGTEALSAIKSVGNKMADTLTGGLTNLTQGRAINPMQEQMLDGIGFRSFNFTYEFYPKSQQEAKMVNDIIFNFRAAMLPDTFAPQEGSDIENFFNYPNIFDVEFEGPIKDKIDGFLPMVCAKCDVDHTGGQKFSTFADGQPIKTQITMEFLEIKILSQENYASISPFATDRPQAGSSILDGSQNSEERIERQSNNDTGGGDG